MSKHTEEEWAAMYALRFGRRVLKVAGFVENEEDFLDEMSLDLGLPEVSLGDDSEDAIDVLARILYGCSFWDISFENTE